MLIARAQPSRGATIDSRCRAVDLQSLSARVVVGAGREHVRFAHGDSVVRLDMIDGTLLSGPVSLRIELAYGQQFSVQLDALQAFDGLFAGASNCSRRHTRLAEMLLPLHAFDERSRGASLRAIADILLGVGDWPGDGEHRKSRVRRLIAAGEAMVRGGPCTVLDRRRA